MDFFKMCLADNLQDATDCGGLPLAVVKTHSILIGLSRVRALPLAAGINEGGHYFGPSGVLALPLAAGINEGGHYWSKRSECDQRSNLGGHYFR
jgi:hypothetical protein